MGRKHKKLLAGLVLLAMMSMTAGCQKDSGEDAEQTEPAEGATYTITKVSGDIDWSKIPTAPIDQVLWTKDTGVRAQGQLCYDEENLYVHLSAVEKNIRAENTEPLSPVWEDSCLEFFFKMKDSDNYFNFEVNPNGCMCIQYGPEKTDRDDIVRRDGDEYFDTHTDRTKDGWEVYYRIPLQFFRIICPDYQFGGELLANLYKCGDKAQPKHYLSWNKINLPEPNFHCPEFFGRMIFEE